MTERNVNATDAGSEVEAAAENATSKRATHETENAGSNDDSALLQELEHARQEAAESQQRYLRTRADMDNFKKRIERTYADRADSSIKELLRKLLAVKDNLERALQYGQSENDEAGEGVMEGVRLTQYQLDQLLSQEGVTAIEANGKPFDPRYGEAVHRVENPDVPDHTVVQVVRQGYIYGDDVLRPAQVVVSVQDENESPE